VLQQKYKSQKDILPFVTQYQPSVPNLKHVLMQKWHLIQNQPSLRQIFKEPPLTSFKRGKSLKDIKGISQYMKCYAFGTHQIPLHDVQCTSHQHSQFFLLSL